MRRPVPPQRKQSSGVGKALLIAGLVLGVTGCLGVSALGFLYWLSQQNGAAGGANTFANAPPFPGQPPPGTFPDPSHAPHPPGGKKVFGLEDGMEDGLIDVPGAHHDDPTALEPGCYLNEAIFESDQEFGANAPWEFVAIVSREQVDCSAARRVKLSAQAQQMARDWPFDEEILQVEDVSPPEQLAGESGFLQKSVRIHTKVSANRP
jgi:hypothetical protein